MKNSKEYDHFDDSKIAIIGMAGRFPGAKNIGELWNNLRDGVESITFFTDKQLLDSGVDPETLNYSNYVKARPVLEGIELFDAAFFGFNSREAACIDPQHRLFIECVWEAIETAGYDTESFKGTIGVYAGARMSSYLLNNLYANPEAMALGGEFQSSLYNNLGSLATGIAYKLNLKGPCYSIQTFCSTSLVAVHMACQGLLNFECDMAVAGGVAISVPQNTGYWFQEGLIVSPNGHCRPFDSKAQGTVFGNGLASVVLKRLEDALADGDHIEAVIIGSATNNDGSMKVSYAAPSVTGQAEVIVEALANADVEPDTITYVETHGTGTALGDPTEVTALTRAFQSGTQKKGFCALGSLKSNIGHLDVAAGVAGLIKTVLALKHQAIPPSLHFETPNPDIDFDNTPFYVNSKLSEWKNDGTPRRAGVSSFGIGGTNAHVILEEAPEIEPSGPSRPGQLLLLSAKTQPALEKATSNLSEYLKQHPDSNVADVVYTLQLGRKTFNHRRFLVCNDACDAIQTLESLDPMRVKTRHIESRDPPVVFMFPGQGAQYLNMGLNLYEHEPMFAETVNLCAEILKPLLGCDIREILYPKDNDSETALELLRKTCFQQPAIFTIEYALAKLWINWGVNPAAMIGHSIGEYVAACLAKVFSLEDALMLVATRGNMMQDLPEGAMLSIRLPAEEIEPRLSLELSIAAVNSPSLCVVSGQTKEVAALQRELESESVICRRLHTSHAFHSPIMDSIVKPFAEHVKIAKLSEPTIPIVSTVTGTWITPGEATDPMYWAGQLRATVRFGKGVQELWENPERVLLEVGPRATCSVLARQQAKDHSKQTAITSLGETSADEAEWTAMLNALGQLWLEGVSIDWENFYERERRQRIALPTYPFERKRFWVEPSRHGLESGTSSLIGAQPMQVGNLEHIFQQKNEQFELEPVSENEINAPRTKAEILLAKIWKELLGVDHVNLDDNFLSDLGGDSLSVVRVIEIIRKITGVSLTTDIILLNTLRQIAPYLEMEPSLAETRPAEETRVEQPAPIARREQDKIKTDLFYFGNSQRKLFGIYHPPCHGAARDLGVLLCYPLSQEYMTTHWAFRQLATLLSRAGFHVLRFDYFGTGDSAGESTEHNVEQCMADILTAAQELKNKPGVNRLSLVGLRFGAALAAQVSANDLKIKDIVLWEPVVSGKSHIKELESLRDDIRSAYMPMHRKQLMGKDYNELLGYPFSQEIRTAIEQIDLINMQCAAEKVFLVASKERNEYSKLRDTLTSRGVRFEYRIVPDTSNWGTLKSIIDVQLFKKMLHTITSLLAQDLT